MMNMRTVCATLLFTIALAACSAQTTHVGRQAETYGKLPLVFEENRGQSGPQVRFLSRGKGYTTFLTASGLTLALRPSEVLSAETPANAARNLKRQSEIVEFALLGASHRVVAVGEKPQPGRANYFIGNDPSKWHTNVPTYRRVRYKDVYPGIDLLYYGNHRKLEYDFVVAPHTDPSNIQFDIKGSRHIDLGADGSLILKIGDGELRFESPTIYQRSDGRRIPVQGKYSIKGPARVGFEVGSFDSRKPLIIDPVLVYSTYLGGGGDDQPTGIVVDPSGSVYVTGYTTSSDFPLATLGSLPSGSNHIFVTKFDSSGTSLVYSDYIGGNSQDFGYALALTSANEVYVTGSTASSDFPVVHPYQSTYPGSFNGFLAKLSSDGSSLLYSTYLGGNGADVPKSILVDGSSSVLVAGSTSSTNFPVVNAFQTTASPNQGGMYGTYGFLTKFSADGSSLVYSTYLAGSANIADNCGGTPCWPEPQSTVAGLASDSAGNAYVSGETNTYDFPVTSGVYQGTNTTPLNGTVGFISKLNPAGGVQYSTYFYESAGFTNPTSIAVDNSGSAYVTGLTFSDGTFPITSTSICDPSVYGSACSYAFVTKFDSTGSTLLYSTFLGPNNYAVPVAIALDSSKDVYVLATTSSNAFTTVNGIEGYSGGNDLLLVEIDPTAESELFATYLGGSADDEASGLALDSIGNLYLTGTTNSTDFPTSQSAPQTQSGGNLDGFVMKVGTIPPPSLSLSPNSLQFSALQLGSKSSAEQILLTNTGGAILTLTSVLASGDFVETNDCGGTIPANGSCTLSVVFAPTGLGQRTGSIVITDNAAGSPHSATLVGVGSDFTVTSANESATVAAGGKASFALTVASVGAAFPNAIQLSCTGQPTFSTCSVSPASVTPGSSSTAATLTVSTTASPKESSLSGSNHQPPTGILWIGLQGLVVFGFITLAFTRGRRANWASLAALCTLCVMCSCAGGTGIVSSGGGGSGGTPAGNYTITVTGTSGSLTHSVALALTVQ